MSELRRTRNLAWLEQRIGRRLGVDAVGYEVVDGPRILGMAAFEWWSASGVGVHVAVDSPLALRHARRLLENALADRHVLWALVAEDSRSLPLALHLGFKESGRVPDGFREGNDLVLLALTRADYYQSKRSRHVR